MLSLSSRQVQRAQAIAMAALAFVEQREAALPATMIRGLWLDGDTADVVSALSAYQNDDGGFGNRLEPDIHAPESNPFAARLAMQVMRTFPAADFGDIKAGLASWLQDNQAEDGDWHFSAATRAGFLQPWFAGWAFPSLNPACCIAGLATSLGIATPRMTARVADLFASMASAEAARTASFYELLPYVEYTLGVELPDDYLDAIAANIATTGSEFDDASHFFDMAMGGSSEITRRVPEELIARWTERMLQEPQEDGGWPTHYDDAWRCWFTATNLTMRAQLRP